VTLPGLDKRRSRRKTKSLLLYQPVCDRGVLEIIMDYLNKGVLNQMDIKAHNPYRAVTHTRNLNDEVEKAAGRRSEESEELDDVNRDSPLLRGYQFEVHFGKSYDVDANMTESEIEGITAKVVDSVNKIGRELQNLLVGVHGEEPHGYPGYIDDDLKGELGIGGEDKDIPAAGVYYYGCCNTRRLATVKREFDRDQVLSTRVDKYLYPVSSKDLQCSSLCDLS